MRTISGVEGRHVEKDTRYDDMIGRTLLCEDDVERRVVEITSSIGFPWLCVINENDPDSKLGHFVHLLTVVHKRDMHAPPSKEAREAFTRLAKKMDVAKADPLSKILTRPKLNLILD
jgi:hypothetical protein